MEPKPYASLSGNLLARKGTARPAMRRPHMGNSGNPALPSSVQDDLGWNDMGEQPPAPPLNMVTEATPVETGVTPSPVTRQQEDLAQKLGQSEAGSQDPASVQASAQANASPLAKKPDDKAEAPLTAAALSAPAQVAPKAKASRAKGSAVVGKRQRKAKAAFTLRLDPERHLRLRLACAVGNRSAQQIVTQALDAFLDSQPDLEKLANQVPQTNGTSDQ